jgi:hypothetical protein
MRALGDTRMPVGNGDRSLSLADVLEHEFAALSGGNAEFPALPWSFDAAQVLKPDSLRARLIAARDPVARGLARGELQALVAELAAKGPPGSEQERDALRETLAAGFNALLEREDFYREGRGGAPARAEAQPDTAARFAGVRFRSQTRERIGAGPLIERNRLIIEDAFPEFQRRDDARLARVFAAAHQRRHAALCLSGGGIRSASFALGVAQGLARLGVLRRFQYLSTVSGGGYLGGWLSAWMHRAGASRVIKELAEPTGRPLAPEPEPVSHLRAYSSYLSPRLGMTSADAWTLGAIYLRNLFLNWLVLIPLLAAALALPQLLLALVRLPSTELDRFIVPDGLFLVLLALSVAATLASVRYLHANRPLASASAPDGIDDPRLDHRAFIRGCFLPMLGAVIGLTILWAWIASDKVAMVTLPVPGGAAAWRIELAIGGWGATLGAGWLWAGAGALLHGGGWLLAPRRSSWREFGFILATGALGGLAAGLIMHGLVPSASPRTLARLQQYAGYVSLAAPALLAAVLFFGNLYVGITSRSQSDATFEWTARHSAWLQIGIACWIASFGVALFIPLAFSWIHDLFADPELITSARAVFVVAVAGAGLVTLRLAFAAPSTAAVAAAAERGQARPKRSFAQALAMPVFLVGLLALMSHFSGWLMNLPEQLSPFFYDSSCPVAASGAPASHYNDALRDIVCGSASAALALLAALVGLGFVLSLRIDTNRFSLHGMYRARLIRAFLGASRKEHERDPNRFTGFDERDDIPLAELGRPEGWAPFHVINVALNLVIRDELASQQRKAVSFTFSPLHSGAAKLGYRPTQDYGGGVSLGTAITISGAAASPTMGYHSSPLLSFLLTLFNVRLGWWLGNPGSSGRKSYHRAAPLSSVRPIVDEALGRTDERNPNVYLSDGGHFENLGLYEMVLRRCRWIVVSDAGCDPRGEFEDLGNAIRRIRVDFGIPITFDAVPIYSRLSADERKPGATYCALGRIGYSEVDGDVEDGTLVYLKPAFYRSEPPEVVNYALTHPDFPHEATSNQFFTEAQFESYRRLGAYIVEHIAGRAAAGSPAAARGAPDRQRQSLQSFAACVERHLRAAGASAS